MPLLIIPQILQNILFLLDFGVEGFVVFGMNLADVVLNIFDSSDFHRSFMHLELLIQTESVAGHSFRDFCNLQNPIIGMIIIGDAVHGLLLAPFVSLLGFGSVDRAVH